MTFVRSHADTVRARLGEVRRGDVVTLRVSFIVSDTDFENYDPLDPFQIGNHFALNGYLHEVDIEDLPAMPEATSA